MINQCKRMSCYLPLLLCTVLNTVTYTLALTDVELYNTVIYPTLQGEGATASTLDCNAGLSCNEANNITTVALVSSDLSGSIPTEIGLLWSLEYIRLSRNELNGSLVSQLGQLINLKELELEGNQLSGPIPSELAQAASLRVLYLQENLLEGAIPVELSSIPFLSLRLDQNRFCSEIPPLGTISTCIVYKPFDDENCFACADGTVINPTNCISDPTKVDCSCQCYGAQTFPPPLPTATSAAVTTPAEGGATETDATSNASKFTAVFVFVWFMYVAVLFL